MGVASVAITTSGSRNCKETGLCCKWDHCSSWHKAEKEKCREENKWVGEWQSTCHSEWQTTQSPQLGLATGTNIGLI